MMALCITVVPLAGHAEENTATEQLRETEEAAATEQLCETEEAAATELLSKTDEFGEYETFPVEADDELLGNYRVDPSDAYFSTAVQNVLRYVDEDMSDFDKILIVHDFLVTHYAYDMYNSAGSVSLSDRVMKCGEYSDLFSYVMTMLEIESKVITSASMNHAWNQVLLDGKWYHTDTSWDDPVDRQVNFDKTPGGSRHRFLLKSDSKISQAVFGQSHYGWSSPIHCTATGLDNTWWSELASPVVKLANGSYVYNEGGDLYVTSDMSVRGKLWVKGFTRKSKSNSLILRYGILYAEDGRDIYSLNPVTGQKQICYSADNDIYGMVETDSGIFVYTLSGGRLTGKDVPLAAEFSDKVPLKKVSIVSSKPSKAGEPIILSAIFTPAGTTVNTKDIKWSSDNEAVAKVKNGVVTVSGYGNANITVEVAGKRASYRIGRELPFDDIPTNGWKTDAVMYVHEKGIMQGVASRKFDPDSGLNRAMFATVLYRIVKEPKVSFKNSFSDVAPGKWYSNAVIWAYGAGITKGYSDGRFGKDDMITREQLCTMLYEFAKNVDGKNVSGVDSLGAFSDAGRVSSYAKVPVGWAVANGILSGKSIKGKIYVDPKAGATRAECAAILMNYMKNR